MRLRPRDPKGALGRRETSAGPSQPHAGDPGVDPAAILARAADEAPRAFLRDGLPSAARSAMAARTVLRATPRCPMSLRSDGNWTPTGSRLCSTSDRNASAIAT